MSVNGPAQVRVLHHRRVPLAGGTALGDPAPSQTSSGFVVLVRRSESDKCALLGINVPVKTPPLNGSPGPVIRLPVVVVADLEGCYCRQAPQVSVETNKRKKTQQYRHFMKMPSAK